MNQPYYKIQNKSTNEADILIYGVIGDSWWEESVTAKRFVNDFKELEKTCSRINVKINSPGGSVFDGLAIFNVINNSPVDVHTYNDGLAASMGAVILLSGKTVHSAKNALTMLHSPMGGAYGTAKDIQNYLVVLDKVKNSLITCICSKSGKKSEDVESKYFDFDDHWLTADEAKAENFIDEIEEREAKVPANVTSMAYSDIVNQFNEIMKPEAKRFNVLNWLNNLSLTNKKNDEMNLADVITILSLDSKASEKDVLDHIKKMVSDNSTLTTERDQSKTDLKAEQDAHAETLKKLKDEQDAHAQTKTDFGSQIENLKKGPGAESHPVTKETDDTRTKQENDFLSADDLNIFNSL